MKLPSTLVDWHEILALFPKDIAALIFHVANQISPLLKLVSDTESQGEITPDGYNGVDRQINYERLLNTEWALQDQFPDEFMRRAVDNEHLFLRLERKQNKESRTCYVLLDCGPEQLGKPRLVQLASLILLARRANADGIEFKWGILQDLDMQLYKGLSKESIANWLSQRSISIAEQTHLDAWADQIDQDCSAFTSEVKTHETSRKYDLWLITKATIKLDKSNLHRIEISEPILVPGQIVVSVQTKTRQNSLNLALTDENLYVRAIRDPFAETRKALILIKENYTGEWVIGPNGMNIACFNSIGRLMLYNLKPKKRSKQEPQQILTQKSDQQYVGIHLSKKHCIQVSIDMEFIYFYNSLTNGRSFKVPRVESIVFDSNKSLFDIAVYRTNKKAKLYFLDAVKRLHAIQLVDENSSFKKLYDEVLILGQNSTCIYCAIISDDKKNLNFYWYLGEEYSSSFSFDIKTLKPTPKVFVHGSGNWHKSRIGALAYENEGKSWSLVSGSRNNFKVSHLIVNQEDRVLGVMNVAGVQLATDSKFKSEVILVLLKPDNTSIHGLSSDGEFVLTNLESEFVRGELNPNQYYLHYMSLKKEMLVVDLLSGKAKLQLDYSESI